MAEPIEIVIRKTQETSTQGAGVGAISKPSNSKKSSTITDNVITSVLINAGKSIASYGVAQYGNMTGNTIAQRNIDNALTIAGYIAQIKTSGWVGAVIVGTQIAMQFNNNMIAIDKANQQAALLYQRSGNITIDGGRGTYD